MEHLLVTLNLTFSFIEFKSSTTVVYITGVLARIIVINTLIYSVGTLCCM